ncbi:MAG TPA: lysophospholipid acyltransferase family protein [Mycobacteriales bacterium]|nr:lysophospholipid acyltransferase family protein [Mycobacteriales bacterium]
MSARPGSRAARGDLRTLARGWRWTHRPLVPRDAQASTPVADRREFPTGWARSGPARAVREVVIRAGLDPLVRAEVQPVVTGLDVLDGLRPPVIFVANHASHLDTALLLCALPADWRRRTAVAAAADYFFDVWWRAVGSALVFNTFPLERRGAAGAGTGAGAGAGAAIGAGTGTGATAAARLLARGWNVVVFPEGTRSADGWTGRVRPGAAYLAAGAGVPIVPVAIRGSYAAMPRGRSWPVPGRPPVHLRFGPPLHPAGGESPRELGGRMRTALARLLDEDATSWWAAAQRSAAGTTPASSGPDAAPWRRRWASSAPPTVAGSRRRVWR